jgi:hypothetical protein
MNNKRILFTNESGGVSIIVPAPGVSFEDVLKAVPVGTPYEVVDADAIPTDRTFRDAWFHDTTPEPQKVGVDLTKAKEIVHGKRREARSAEFAPLDVEATIPSKAVQAEAARQAIRDKYSAIQADIDSAPGVEELKLIVGGL